MFALSRRGEQRLCIVCRTPGHERPAAGRNGLCLSCDSGRRLRGQTVDGVRRERGAASFVWALRSLRALGRLRRPSVVHGLPFSLGLARQARPRGVRGHPAAPLARGKPWDRGRLSALAERLRLEILYAFQQIWLDGGYVWEGTRRLQWLIDALARVDARSLLER